jgi:hypothetical protein
LTQVVAFAGPSVPPALRSRLREVDWRPPAQAGDLLDIGPRPNLILCLIDGYFDHRPAVRHKELLWLLAGGVRIIGGASIGALRAAEMAAFGMEGVGAIYRAYAAGRLVGDDEVALIHGPIENGWRPLSVPLVDVRATLWTAVRRGLLSGADARAVLVSAQRFHYSDRSWPQLLSMAGVDEARLRSLASWIERARPSRKEADAAECLAAAVRPAPRFTPPQAVRTAFLAALARDRGLELPPTPQTPCP